VCCPCSKLSNIAYYSDLTWVHPFSLQLCPPRQQWDTRREEANGNIPSLSGKQLLTSSGYLTDIFSPLLTAAPAPASHPTATPWCEENQTTTKTCLLFSLLLLWHRPRDPLHGPLRDVPVTTSLFKLNSFMTSMDGKGNDVNKEQV